MDSKAALSHIQRDQDNLKANEGLHVANEYSFDEEELMGSPRTRSICANCGIAVLNFMPPLGVAVSRRSVSDACIALVLTAMLYFPGLIFAFYCQFTKAPSRRCNFPCTLGL